VALILLKFKKTRLLIKAIYDSEIGGIIIGILIAVLIFLVIYFADREIYGWNLLEWFGREY